jgi:DNA-binding IscR family transcriptional regulator
MSRNNKIFTSDEIALMLSTNPVVVRRTMAGLKKPVLFNPRKDLKVVGY